MLTVILSQFRRYGLLYGQLPSFIVNVAPNSFFPLAF